MNLWFVFLGFFVLFSLPLSLLIFFIRFKKNSVTFKTPNYALLENLPMGVIVMDDKQDFVMINRWLKKECVDSSIWQQHKPFMEFAHDAHTQALDIHIKNKDFHVHKIAEGPYQIFTFQLSEQKKIHDVGKDFVANASHELRTPITIIKGFTETLRDLPEISDAMLHDFTEKILRSCQRMDNLVKNLLLLADLDHSKRIHRRPSDLLSLIESVSYTLLSIHPEVLIETLTKDEEINFSFDPDMLEQALLNLLENAVKYSPQAAEITIIAEKQEKGIVLKIQDKGVGIPKEHLPYIFQRFYRVNQDRSRKLGGAGLGLSIVKAIIEKHHGHIQADSSVGEGTTFTIFFKSEADATI